MRDGERLLREIAAAFEEVGTGATTKEIGEAIAALRPLQEQMARRVKELRDMDEWRRFANVQQQEELIAMAEAIVASLKAEEEAGTDTELAATATARELSCDGRPWRTRRAAQRLWDRFKPRPLHPQPLRVYFAQLRQERSANLAAKAALLEQAERCRLDRLEQDRHAVPGAAEAWRTPGRCRATLGARWRGASAPRATRSSRVAATS